MHWAPWRLWIAEEAAQTRRHLAGRSIVHRVLSKAAFHWIAVFEPQLGYSVWHHFSHEWVLAAEKSVRQTQPESHSRCVGGLHLGGCEGSFWWLSLAYRGCSGETLLTSYSCDGCWHCHETTGLFIWKMVVSFAEIPARRLIFTERRRLRRKHWRPIPTAHPRLLVATADPKDPSG